MNVDAIVVGAGPGGSSAARELASRGHSVLLLDRQQFPRDKPCGGAISPRTRALLPFDITSVVEHVVTGIVLGDPCTKLVHRDVSWPIAFMTQRRRFDALLAEHAQRAGAEFRDGQPVRHVDALPDGSFEVRVEGDGAPHGDMHRARVVIGADGANGPVARALNFPHPRAYGVAIEGNVPIPGGVPAWIKGRMALTVPVFPGGYGWVFPKGDHLNVGVGGRERAGPLRDVLDEYARTFGWAPSDLQNIRGHRLPLQQRGMTVAKGAAALVGDAAGLVDPLLGEGIYGAVYSGLAAARAADAHLAGRASDLAAYQREVDNQLGVELARSHVLAAILAAWPGPVNWAATHSSLALALLGLLVIGEVRLRERNYSLAPIVTALTPLAALGRRVAMRDRPPSGRRPTRSRG